MRNEKNEKKMNEDVTGKNKQVSDTNFNKNNNDYQDYYQYSHAADMFRYRARLRSKNDGESSNLHPVKHTPKKNETKTNITRSSRESIYIEEEMCQSNNRYEYSHKEDREQKELTCAE